MERNILKTNDVYLTMHQVHTEKEEYEIWRPPQNQGENQNR